MVTSLREGLAQQRLTVEVEHVEGEDAHLHLEVVHVRILALARREHLEGHDRLLDAIVGDGLRVEYEGRDAGRHRLG